MDAAELLQTETDLPPPRANAELFGHEPIEKALLADIAAARLPHALILAGPPGIGKATLAFRLARYLLATPQQDGGLFGDAAPVTSLYVAPQIPVARRVASGGHADLLTIERPYDEKKGRFLDTIPVEEVRRIEPFLRKTAAEGGWRAVIVDGAESLNRAGQNALLKILEEPPEKVLLVLTTSQPGAFLPTVRSRCRLVTMNPLPENVVLQLLQKTATDISPQDQKTLVRLGEGSIGRSLDLYNEGGLDLYRTLIDSLSNVPAVNYIAVHDLAETLGRKGAERSCRTFMSLLIWWLGRMAREASRGKMPIPVIPEESALMQNLSQVYTARDWLTLWEQTGSLVREAEHANLDKRQTVLRIFRNFER